MPAEEPAEPEEPICFVVERTVLRIPPMDLVEGASHFADSGGDSAASLEDLEDTQETGPVQNMRSAEDLQDLEEDLKSDSSDSGPEEVYNNGGPVRITGLNRRVWTPIFGEPSESGASASGS